MRLTSLCHQVLGECSGKRLSHASDCNAFVVETSHGPVMFDAGSGYDLDLTFNALADAGFPNGPRHLFLTHAHADHAGGAGAISRACGTRLHAATLTREWLLTGDENRTSLAEARKRGVYPVDYKPEIPIAIDLIHSGATIKIGEVVITPIASPGHSADHHCYLVSTTAGTVLVAGDAIFADGKVILQDTWDSFVRETCASIRGLSLLTFDALLPGHGASILVDAKRPLAAAMERIDRLLPPLNLL